MAGRQCCLARAASHHKLHHWANTFQRQSRMKTVRGCSLGPSNGAQVRQTGGLMPRRSGAATGLDGSAARSAATVPMLACIALLRTMRSPSCPGGAAAVGPISWRLIPHPAIRASRGVSRVGSKLTPVRGGALAGQPIAGEQIPPRSPSQSAAWYVEVDTIPRARSWQTPPEVVDGFNRRPGLATGSMALLQWLHVVVPQWKPPLAYCGVCRRK